MSKRTPEQTSAWTSTRTSVWTPEQTSVDRTSVRTSVWTDGRPNGRLHWYGRPYGRPYRYLYGRPNGRPNRHPCGRPYRRLYGCPNRHPCRHPNTPQVGHDFNMNLIQIWPFSWYGQPLARMALFRHSFGAPSGRPQVGHEFNSNRIPIWPFCAPRSVWPELFLSDSFLCSQTVQSVARCMTAGMLHSAHSGSECITCSV